MKNELWKFLSSEEKQKVFRESCELKEDYIYLQIMIDRNKTSSFAFELIPNKSKLLQTLWNNYYKTSLDDLNVMLTEYMVAKKFIEGMYNELLESPEIKSLEAKFEVFRYFQNIWELDLTNYVGDFIGCSMGCTETMKKLCKLNKEHLV